MMDGQIRRRLPLRHAHAAIRRHATPLPLARRHGIRRSASHVVYALNSRALLWNTPPCYATRCAPPPLRARMTSPSPPSRCRANVARAAKKPRAKAHAQHARANAGGWRRVTLPPPARVIKCRCRRSVTCAFACCCRIWRESSLRRRATRHSRRHLRLRGTPRRAARADATYAKSVARVALRAAAFSFCAAPRARRARHKRYALTRRHTPSRRGEDNNARRGDVAAMRACAAAVLRVAQCRKSICRRCVRVAVECRARARASAVTPC